jgi:hypothetical protein
LGVIDDPDAADDEPIAMSDDNKGFDSFTVSPCSRGEAVEMAIQTGVIAHLVICLLAPFGLATYGAAGLWAGFGISCVLAAAIPFVLVPVTAAIGFFTHLTFHRTQVPIPTLVRVLVILFEASLLGWAVLIAMMVP